MVTSGQPFSITFSGPDGQGILALLCRALHDMGCALADARMAQLAGQCVGIVIVGAPEGSTEKQLSRGLNALREHGLRLQVREPPSDGWRSFSTPFTRSYMVSYEGADHPELTGSVAEALSAAGCNFMDVSVDSALGDRSDAFVFVCEIIAPLERAEVEAILARVGEEHGVTLTVIPADMDDITIGG